MRLNVYKEKILAVLEKSHLMSIADVQKKVIGADFSTVFRNVEQLCADGLVRKLVVSKDIVLYEKIEKSHHDHFVCNGCGTVETVYLPTKIALAGKAVATDILIRGTCDNCVK